MQLTGGIGSPSNYLHFPVARPPQIPIAHRQECLYVGRMTSVQSNSAKPEYASGQVLDAIAILRFLCFRARLSTLSLIRHIG